MVSPSSPLCSSFVQAIGAVLAVVAFRFVRPSEFDKDKSLLGSVLGDIEVPELASKLTAEGIGTFLVVVTVGLNVLQGAMNIDGELLWPERVVARTCWLRTQTLNSEPQRYSRAAGGYER